MEVFQVLGFVQACSWENKYINNRRMHKNTGWQEQLLEVTIWKSEGQKYKNVVEWILPKAVIQLYNDLKNKDLWEAMKAQPL